MGGKKKKLDEILETVQFIVQFLQEKAATKDELHDVETGVNKKMMRLEDKIGQLEVRLENKIEKLDAKLEKEVARLQETIIDHVDGFVTLHKCLDTETIALKSAMRRHEDYFDQLSGRLKLDFQNS